MFGRGFLYGIAVRDARGEVFRFAPLEGENMADFLPISKEPRRYCVEFKRAFAGDMSVTDCPPERRDLFAGGIFVPLQKALYGFFKIARSERRALLCFIRT